MRHPLDVIQCHLFFREISVDIETLRSNAHLFDLRERHLVSTPFVDDAADDVNVIVAPF